MKPTYENAYSLGVKLALTEIGLTKTAGNLNPAALRELLSIYGPRTLAGAGIGAGVGAGLGGGIGALASDDPLQGLLSGALAGGGLGALGGAGIGAYNKYVHQWPLGKARPRPVRSIDLTPPIHPEGGGYREGEMPFGIPL